MKSYTKRFQKSYKKVLRSGKIKQGDVALVIDFLAKGENLSSQYFDHNLRGEYEGYKECHIKFDLLLVYKIYEKDMLLQLYDIGTHSELFS